MIGSMRARRFSLIVFVTALLLPFQNCSGPKVHHGGSGGEEPAPQMSGNGDAYEGKLTRYSLLLPQSCFETGANGQPLPNRQIHLFGTTPNTRAFLVRDNCADLDTPVLLDSAQVSINGTGDLIYQGAAYKELKAVGDFDVVAAACPAGKTSRPSPVHTNMFASSQDLTDYSAYMQVDGIQTALTGSLGGLPRFQILRNDPAYLDFWRRISQVLPMSAGRTYSFTFFAKPGTTDWAGFGFYESQSLTFTRGINLVTGAVRDDGTVGVQNVSVTSRPFSGGRVVTVYFYLPQAAAYGASGVFPSTATGGAFGNLGDSIEATAFQLEDVANFCQ